MRVRIELDIQPNEVPLATEFLSVLRTLTEHASGRGPAPAGVSNGAVHQPPTVVITNRRELYESSIRRLVDPQQVHAVTSELTTIMQADPDANNAVKELADVFNAIVFNPQMPPEESAEPYLSILTTLPEPYLKLFRKNVVSTVATFLNAKRAVDVDRTEFLTHADVFAGLALCGAIMFDGALKLVNKLVQEPLTRAAGVTIMGKLCEKCYSKFKGPALRPEELEQQTLLRASLSRVTEGEFEYDIEYISDTLEWPEIMVGVRPGTVAQASGGGASIAAPPQQQGGGFYGGLACAGALGGHPPGSVIYCLAFDSLHNQLISGDSLGNLVFYDSLGVPNFQHSVAPQYCLCLDVHPKANVVLAACAKQKNRPDGSCMMQCLLKDTEDPARWTQVGECRRQELSMLTYIKCFNDDDFQFITSDSYDEAGYKNHIISLYDMSAAKQSFNQLAPISVMRGHTNNITCLALVPDAAGQFVSSSVDQTILLWDKRLHEPVGRVGLPGVNGSAICHGQAITTVDVRDNLILSGCVDGTVAGWDLRMLGSDAAFRVSVPGASVTRLAYGPAYTGAAIATTAGVYLLDTRPGVADTQRLRLASPNVSGAEQIGAGRYLDVKWDKNGGRLFAAHDNLRVDIFHVHE